MLPRSKCAVFAFVHSLLYNPPFMGDKKIFLEPSVSHVIVITRFVLDIKLNPQSGALPGVDGRIERKIVLKIMSIITPLSKAPVICIRCSVD